MILDNFGTHKHANTRTCLARPPLDHPFHPDIKLMLNAVDGVFAKLTRRRLKYGVFKSVDNLKAAIDWSS